MKSYVDIVEFVQPPPNNGDRPITWTEIAQLRDFLDQLWEKLGIDVSFTNHFMERVNDPRNKKQITLAELSKLFLQTYKQHGKNISLKVKPESDGEFEAVLTDLSTKINLPFALEWNRKQRELKMVAKTVMRKDNFVPSYNNGGHQKTVPKLTVQHFEPENTMKSKTYSDLKEWVNSDGSKQLNEFVGFDTPEVAPIASTQAVDDVDSAAFAVDQPEILDKLNAYCGEIANHQYINPYYPLNALWKKLSMVGINFNLKSVMLTGPMGSTTVPLNRFGGRYGTLGGPEYVSHDDGTGIPGGLSLIVSWAKTGGVYSLNAHIEHGSTAMGFGESVNEELIHGKKLNPEQHKKVLSAYVHRHTGEHKPAWAKKPMQNGQAYKPTHATDKEWVHDHAFHFNKGTNNLSAKHKYAEPGFMAEADQPLKKK
jgi:hypothetical protein